MRINPICPTVRARPRRSKEPTAAQRRRWDKVAALGCAIDHCYDDPEIHHAFTGAGGRKNHDKVFGLCHCHHRGRLGIHAPGIGRRAWQERFGHEQDYLDWVARALGE